MAFNVDGLKLLADTVELVELQPTSSSSEPERMTRVRPTSSSCEQERVTELQPTSGSCEQEQITELQTTASSEPERMEWCGTGLRSGPSQTRVAPRWNSASLEETAEIRLDDEIINEVPIDDELEEDETAETCTSQQASEGHPAAATHVSPAGLYADEGSYSKAESDEENHLSTLEETSHLPIRLTKERFESFLDMEKLTAARDPLQDIQANVQASDRGMHLPGMQTVTAARDRLQEIQAPAQASHLESLPLCYQCYANIDDQIIALQNFIRNTIESPSPEGSPSGNT